MIDGDAGGKVLALVESQGDIARLTAGPPGIPEDRLDALRKAYAAATADPEFLAKAEKLGLPVDPATGDKLAAAIAKALNQPPEMRCVSCRTTPSSETSVVPATLRRFD